MNIEDLDTVIERFNSIDKSSDCPFPCMYDCSGCIKQCKLIAKCLEELKFLRQWKSEIIDEFCKYDCNSIGEAIHNGYNKGIDDFVNLAKDHTFKHHKEDITSCCIGFIEFFAEQLKAGETE